MTKEHDEHAKKHDEHAEAAKSAANTPATKPMDVQPRRDDAEMERMRREDPLFIEKTRPEDPSGRAGQLTRDNVNPAIPSGKRGDPPGPIVDPSSLGMPQGGVAPFSPMQPEKSPDQKPRLPGQDQPSQPEDSTKGKK